MRVEQVMIGLMIAALCGIGQWHAHRLLTETSKGKWLVRKLGEPNAMRALRAMLALGLVFGLLLAANVIRPVQW